MTTPTPAPAPMTATPDTRPPVEHELKTWASYFHALVEGAKTFELRRDDRGFRIGDTLRLRETDYGTGDYTGRELTRRITHILRHETDLGLMDGFCILSLADTAIPDDWQPTAANINALPLAVEGAEKALEFIAAHKGKTLISTEHGEGYSHGANAGFEQLASAAEDALGPTLTPSVDCKGGCGWHGFIVNGERTP